MVNLKNEDIDIAITCTDFGKTRYFFETILGLDVVMEFKVDKCSANNLGLATEGFTQTRFALGNTKIKLLEFETKNVKSTNHHAGLTQGERWITLYVSDICETYKTLVAKGYEFIGDIPTKPKGALVLKGPEGILIEFIGN